MPRCDGYCGPASLAPRQPLQHVSVQILEHQAVVGKTCGHRLIGNSEGGHGADEVGLHDDADLVDLEVVLDLRNAGVDAGARQRDGGSTVRRCRRR